MGPRKLMKLIAATLLVLLLGAAEARRFAGVNPFCRTASYRRICTQMVSGAANQHDAAVNAVKSTMTLAERLRALVPTIEPEIAHLPPLSRDSVRESCVQNFDSVVDNLGVSLRALEAGDIATAKTYLSASASAECADAINEFGIGSELLLTKYSAHLTQRVDNCLAVILQE